MATDFPTKGDDQKISLRNSQYPQFDRTWASNLKREHPDVWKAGGNIRGNDAYLLWGRAREGSETDVVLDWIKEREAWIARHFEDGSQFKGDTSPTLSSIAGVVAQIKWGAIGTLGEGKMKEVVNAVIAKRENRAEVSSTIEKGLRRKVEEHNEEYGDDARKRATYRMLEACFLRGVGAYKTNPQSVRPNVKSADQWAYARVNGLLYALRNLRFRRTKYDTDLLPAKHPLSTKGKNSMSENQEKREKVGEDQYTTEKEALDRARTLGCSGFHTMTEDGVEVFMPCETHSEYTKYLNKDEEPTESDESPEPMEPSSYNRSEDRFYESRALQNIELSNDEDETELPTIVGYAAKFDSDSQDLGGFVERIDRKAFDRALSEQHDVRALVDHDSSKIIGRSASGTLRMSTDDVGLRVEIDPANTQAGRDVVESIRRGDIDGMSFGFQVIRDSWSERDGTALRTVQDLSLKDVSTVSFPAYPATEVALRSLERQCNRKDGNGLGVDLAKARLRIQEMQ
jgi:HK97 family phage prohead protease